MAGEPLTAQEQAQYADLDAKALQTFTNVDLADYLVLHQKDLTARGEAPEPGEEVARYALRALGQPYRLGGARFDYSESDCVVAVERCIALALSKDWGSYYRLCERLRHKDGKVDFLERNFMTLTQWVPNNSWILRDITADLGSASAFQHIAAPKRFYSQLSFGDQEQTETGCAKAAAKAAKIAAAPERVTTTETYIERPAVADVLDGLQTGDLALVLREFKSSAGEPLLDCDHMGVIVRGEYDVVFMVQSTYPRVSRVPILTFLQRFPRVAGFKFLRLRDNAGQLVEEELARMSPRVVVPVPGQKDTEVQVLRARRITAGKASGAP